MQSDSWEMHDVDVMMASMTAPRFGNCPNGICHILDMKSTTT